MEMLNYSPTFCQNYIFLSLLPSIFSPFSSFPPSPFPYHFFHPVFPSFFSFSFAQPFSRPLFPLLLFSFPSIFHSFLSPFQHSFLLPSFPLQLPSFFSSLHFSLPPLFPFLFSSSSPLVSNNKDNDAWDRS